MFTMKKQKMVSGILLVVILLSTMMSWFGGGRGVQEIKGTLILLNPLTILFVLAVIVSLFIKKAKTSIIIRTIGFSGIVGMEIWYFLTWYILTITGEFNISTSFNMAYPEFYLSLVIACIPLIHNIILFVKSENIDNE